MAGFDVSRFVLLTIVIAAASYLLGSINSAIIVSRIVAGEDIRHHGSGNAGMTNMLRTYGKMPAMFTALGDFLKAVISVVFARILFYFAGYTLDSGFPVDAGYIAGLFVLLGHLFPAYFHFKGGKGVVTILGVMMIVNPIVFLITAVIFIPLVFITKIVSLGSVIGAVCYPVLTWFVLTALDRPPLYDTVCAVILAAIILLMHRGNISRLLSGTENKFGGKKPNHTNKED